MPQTHNQRIPLIPHTPDQTMGGVSGIQQILKLIHRKKTSMAKGKNSLSGSVLEWAVY